MNTTIVAIVRHILTGVGVLLAQKGFASEAEFEAAAGALITLGSLGWMIYSKQKAKKTETAS